MRMNEIMSSPVFSVDADATGNEAYNEMKLHNTHHVVVKDGRDIVGVVSSRDLAAGRDRPVTEIMSHDVVTAEPTTTVKQAANRLRGRTIGCLPIVEKGKLVGIVTTTDLLELLGRGAISPSPRAERWTLKGRGVRRRSQADVTRSGR